MEAKALALEAIAEEIRGHEGCGQEPCETATNMVPGEGNPDARVVIVGEAPGASEDESGRPFVGGAGRLLDQLLEAAGISREDVFITNVVKARPPGNRDPKRPEVEHHLPWLLAQLAIIEPDLVVPLGRHALSHFAPDLKISQARGVAVERDGRALFPMLHPAAALYRRQLRDALFEDAGKLGEELRKRA